MDDPMPSVLTKTILHPSTTMATSTPVGKLVDEQTATSQPKAARNPALDFTKGTLVLIMVLYHWADHFTHLDWGFYKYLHFLTPSFIFITGFMISNVYLSKYAAADPRLSRRLFTRGMKLMAIFLILNLPRLFVIPGLGNAALATSTLDFKSATFAVFVSGNLPVVGSKLAAFSILVPISYVLVFSGALMLPYRFYRRTFQVVCALLLLSLLALGLGGTQSPNLEFVTIGMLGVLTGFVSIEAINDFVRHPYALVFAYVGYTIAITIWDVPFLLLIVGVSLSLMVIFLIGGAGTASGKIRSEVILLGKYSLFGYISQIAILQVLSSILHHSDLGYAGLFVSLTVAFALTIVSVKVLDRARARTASVDRLYKVVFA